MRTIAALTPSRFAECAKASKSWLFIFSMIFAIVIHKTHAAYLYPEHAYLGFPYVPMGVPEWAFIVISVFLVAFSLPLNLLRPSGIISFMMYVIVFLPTLGMVFKTGAEKAVERMNLAT